MVVSLRTERSIMMLLHPDRRKMDKKAIKTIRSRERIIRCATELFGEKGYDDFAVNGLCTQYGISKGLFYHNFSGKDELFLRCVEDCYKKLLDVLTADSEIPGIERYIELRLRFFEENPHLSRIFFESFIQTEAPVFEGIKEARKSLIDFNRLVYSNFLNTIELRQGITREDAMEYFGMLQEMINRYYSNPVFRKEHVKFLETEHRKTLSKFLEYTIFGIVKKEI